VARRGRGQPPSYAPTPEAPTGIYFVTHDGRGHHFTFYRKGSAASAVKPADVPEEAIGPAQVLHLSGITLGISDTACDAGVSRRWRGRERRARVSGRHQPAAPALAAAPRRACIHAALVMADLAFPSLDDAQALTGVSISRTRSPNSTSGSARWCC
jgi:2-dehydro-3-deoxygluconokinase